jgi:hypothetical protein
MTQPACHQLDGGARTIYDYDYEWSPGHADLENSDVAVTVQTQR